MTSCIRNLSVNVFNPNHAPTTFAKRRIKEKNMNKRKNEILEDNVVISLDNIEKISKVIALASLRNFVKYAYSNTKRIETLRKQLQKDIRYHNELDSYSDAYDIVQEASLFLLKFLNKILGDNCIFVKPTAKKPETISIRVACFKTLFAYLRKEMKNGNSEDMEILNFIPAEEQNKEQQDYTKANAIIKKLVTNKLESQILKYYYNGVEPKIIAEFLGVSSDIVYKRRRKFKDRYLMYCI